MTTLATALPIHAAALIGDLNNDGVVDKQDAKILSEYFAGYPHDIDTVAADVNADGKVTRQDGMILNRYADGWDGYEIATEEEAAAAIYTQALDEEHIQTATFTEEDETYESMYVDNEILIVVDEDLVGREYVETLVEPYGGTVVGQVPIVGFYQVEIEGTPTLAKLEEVIDAVSDAEHVEDAYLNTVMEYDTDAYYPNDPYDGSDNLWDDSTRTWHLRATHVPEAWELVYSVNDDPSIVMGVIDDNFDENHPDLDINILSRKNNQLTGESDPDGVKHGTHVAGILGAKTNNTEGVCGIAINPTIYCVAEQREAYQADRSGLGAQAEWIEDYSRIIEESRNNGKKMIINMSLGYGTSSYKPTKDEVEQITNSLLKLEDDGYDFLIVTSAGNQGRDSKHNTVKNSFITAITDESIKDNIIVVGNARPVNYSNNSVVNDASFSDGFIRFEGSSYRGGRVDIMAPGTDVVSTIASSSSPVWRLPQGYSKLTGTSQASPVVAGIAALVWEANPNLTPEQVKEILIDTADIPVDGNGDDDCPNMVNAEAAVRKAISYRNDLSRLTAHAIDNETNAGISNATIRLSFVDSTGTTTATSDPFTLSDIGIDMYFNTDSVYNTAIVSADGYTTKTIQLTDDNMITENTILHYSLGDIRLEKVVEETTHTVSGTVVDANGALAGVTVACSHGTTTTSNASGSYSFALPDGTYTLTFTLDGYETTTRTVTVNGSDCSVDVVTMATVEDEDIVASGECGDDLTWKLDTDGTLTISGTGDMWDYEYSSQNPWHTYSSIQNLIIEEGVTHIGNYAFADLSSYYWWSSISLPSTLISIGRYAFTGVSYSYPLYLPENLKILECDAFYNSRFYEIYIPASVEKIGYSNFGLSTDDTTRNVFRDCDTLKKIVVDEANPYFCSEDGILYTKDMSTLVAYPQGKNDSTYVMPNSISNVIDDAFSCRSTCKLKNVTLSASLSDLSSYVRYTFIEHFDTTADNPYFCAIDGVVYSKDKTRIELYPSGNTAYSYDILDGTEVIASYAFNSCKYLLTINIPESVTTIESHAIYGCPCINNLVIPSQVTHFYIDFSCNNLTKIYFMGDAPIIDFAYTRESPTLYCIEGKEGWTVPTWDCHVQTYNTAYFDPDTVNLNTIASGTCGDNITWKVDKNGVLSLRGTGSMDNYYYIDYTPWCQFKKTIRKIILGEGITSVGDYAFANCELVEKISLPNTITTIGEYAFGGSQSLTAVSIPDGVLEIGDRAFSSICGFDIFIPASVQILRNRALAAGEGTRLFFYGDVPTTCEDTSFGYYWDTPSIYYIEGKSGWTSPSWVAPYGATYTTATFDPDSVTIEPNDPLPPAEIIASGECGMNGDNVTWTLDDSYALTVTGTGEMADYSYTSDNLAPWSSYRDQITSITIGEGITDTGEFTFYCCKNVPGEITIPYGVTTLGKCSFEGLEKVTSYNIPSTVQQIDGFVFKNNTNLQTLTIPDGVTSIGEETFLGCQNLTHVDIPEGVTSIGYSAFYDCYALSSITLPDSLTSVGNTAFWNTGLTGTLYIPKNISSIGYNAFYCNYSLEAFEVDPANTLLMSQDGVLYTHDQTELIQYPRGKTDESYTIPSGVTVIGRLGMAQNGNIKAVTLPETLVEIGEYAFWNSGLTSITLPASLTKLGSRSFEYCGNLTDIYFCGDVPETCGENVATSCNSALTLHYIEGKSGWTTPTWTAPDGKVYNTAVWNP